MRFRTVLTLAWNAGFLFAHRRVRLRERLLRYTINVTIITSYGVASNEIVDTERVNNTNTILRCSIACFFFIQLTINRTISRVYEHRSWLSKVILRFCNFTNFILASINLR